MFFSVINTTEGLQEIDAYAQDCIRYMISGRHTKLRYNVRYEQMKKLGYRTLVNAYYADRDERKSFGGNGVLTGFCVIISVREQEGKS